MDVVLESSVATTGKNECKEAYEKAKEDNARRHSERTMGVLTSLHPSF